MKIEVEHVENGFIVTSVLNDTERGTYYEKTVVEDEQGDYLQPGQTALKHLFYTVMNSLEIHNSKHIPNRITIDHELTDEDIDEIDHIIPEDQRSKLYEMGYDIVKDAI